MKQDDKEACLRRYNRRLTEYGYDSKTLGWSGGKKRQNIRFQALMDIDFFLHEKISSVLDVGCGFGDMGAYLKYNYPEINYCGIDINENLIKVGREKFGFLDLRVLDILSDDIETFDIVVESGIFNYKPSHGWSSQLNYIKSMLEKFNDLSVCGFSADFMSTYVDYQAINNFHMFPDVALSITKKICGNAVLRHDYLDYEFSVYGIKK